MVPELRLIATDFGLGTCQGAALLTGGILNQTWRLDTSSGTYIVQQLHGVFAPGVTVDAQYLTQYLHTQKFPVPQYLVTTTGTLHWQNGPEYWRVMTCLSGQSWRTAPQLNFLEAAGQKAGWFHRLVAPLNYDFQFQLPHFHDTVYILEKLGAMRTKDPIAHEATFFLETIPPLLLPTTLPRQIIHGDLKLANFLFDDQGQVTGLVDWDTAMVHYRLVELGDALRSWGTVGQGFGVEAFKAGLEGYLTTGTLTDQELSYVVPAVQLITLELGMRYLIDVIEDYYFAWDTAHFSSRQAHNLARAQRQIAIYRDIVRQERALVQAISEIIKRNLSS